MGVFVYVYIYRHTHRTECTKVVYLQIYWLVRCRLCVSCTISAEFEFHLWKNKSRLACGRAGIHTINMVNGVAQPNPSNKHRRARAHMHMMSDRKWDPLTHRTMERLFWQIETHARDNGGEVMDMRDQQGKGMGEPNDREREGAKLGQIFEL